MDFIKIDPPGGVPTADFLTTGPTDWWINAYFVLLETVEMCMGYYLHLERRCQSNNLNFLETWMIFRGSGNPLMKMENL